MHASNWLIRLGVVAAGFAVAPFALAAAPSAQSNVQVIRAYQSDVSLPLYYLPPNPNRELRREHEAPENPPIPNHHVDTPDPVVQAPWRAGFISQMPDPIMNFDGVGSPDSDCGCAPPDTNGAVGTTQYLQIVNMAFEVFDKATGDSVLGPEPISSVWSGFGGVCENNASGDPIAMHDQLANRWIISQFAGTSVPTDECVAISSTDDATGTWTRYAFHLGNNFFDYPKLGVWPDAYYMSMNVFNSSGTAYIGPQAFAMDRVAMLAGDPNATIVTTGITNGEDFFMPADLDGDTPPPNGAPNPFLVFPSSDTYRVYHFHADFATPANTTFSLFDSEPAAGFTQLCPGNRSCVPELGGEGIDGMGDRLLFRMAYRNFGDHESLLGTFGVKTNNVAGVRWFELRNVTGGPVQVYQESTFQPDTDWRWMSSIAMDSAGNIAIGYSASSASIHPQLRYAGRLATDPLNSLAQGETHLFDGAGSQQSTGNRWGDYSALTPDPVDDCTFWYTNEYYATTGSFGWSTRIGSFQFSACGTPTFTTSGTNLTQDVCAASSTPTALQPATITVGSRNGFTDPVTMSFGDGLPTGFLGSYSVNPVTPPGTTDADLTVDNTATPGANAITLRGSADGTDRDLVLTANVSTASAPAATLTYPANGSNSIPVQPTFTWQASAQATSYLIEVATDANFSNIIVSQSVAGTSFQPSAALPTNTQIWWRVTAGNVCGGAVSAVSSFVTQPGPGQCSSGTPVTTLFSDNVENGTNGWTHGANGVADTWTRGNAAHDGSFAWQANNPPSGTPGNQWLVSPAVALPTGLPGLTLQYWNEQDMKSGPNASCYDGAIVEVSLDGGSTWTQVAGSNLLTTPYDGTISDGFGNPLGGDQGWCGDPAAYALSIVDLSSWAGQTVQFRFNFGNDHFQHRSDPAWAIDDIVVQGCGEAADDTIFEDGFDGTP